METWTPQVKISNTLLIFGVIASTQKQEPHKHVKLIQKMGTWLWGWCCANFLTGGTGSPSPSLTQRSPVRPGSAGDRREQSSGTCGRLIMVSVYHNHRPLMRTRPGLLSVSTAQRIAKPWSCDSWSILSSFSPLHSFRSQGCTIRKKIGCGVSNIRCGNVSTYIILKCLNP